MRIPIGRIRIQPSVFTPGQCQRTPFPNLAMWKSRLPALLLSILLQVSPLVRVALAESAVVGRPILVVLRWLTGSVALLGGYHAYSGATQVTITQGGVKVGGPVGTNGVPFQEVQVSMFNGFGHPQSFTFADLPPGLSGTTDGRVIGLPSREGVYEVTVNGLNFTGGEVKSTSTFPIYVFIPDPPEILTPPKPAAVVYGGSFTLTATVSGYGLSYQWYRNGFPMNTLSALSPSLTVTPAGDFDTGAYVLKVTNSGGTVSTDPVQVNVLRLPQILEDPQSTGVVLGGAFTLKATTYPSNLSYQWFKEGVPIPAPQGTEPTYSVTSASNSDLGSYTLKISNAVGSATSASARVVLATAPQIYVSPYAAVKEVGGYVTFYFLYSGGGSIQWFKDGVPLPGTISNYLNLGPVTPADAGVYTATVTNNLGSASTVPTTLTVVSQPALLSPLPDLGTQPGGTVTWNAMVSGNGLQYQWYKNGVAIPAPQGTGASLTLTGITDSDLGLYSFTAVNRVGSISSLPARLTFDVPPVIRFSPTDRTVVAGSAVVLSLDVQGASLVYQWSKDGSPITGATGRVPSLGLTPARESDSGVYTVTVSNPAGSVTSAPARITVVTMPRLTAAPTNRVVPVGTPVVLDASASGGGLSFQWTKDGVTIPGPRGTAARLELGTVGAGDAGVYAVTASNLAGSSSGVIATLTIAIPPVLTSLPAGFQAGEGSVARLTVDASGTGLTYQWTKNGSPIPGPAGNAPTLVFNPLSAGDAGLYSITVGNDAGSVSTDPVMVIVVARPVMVTQPVSQTVRVGGAVTLTGSASGVGLSYQWLKDEVPLPGPTGTDAALFLPAVTASDAGRYVLRVTNLGGTISSTPAILSVTAEPVALRPNVIVNVVGDTAYAGESVTFTARVSSVDPVSFQWVHDGSPIPGATSPALVLPSVKTVDSGSYRVEVTVGAAQGRSDAMDLTVVEFPAATLVRSAPDQPWTLTFATVAGRAYVVEESGSLAESESGWSEVASISAEGEVTRVSLPASARTTRFWRARPVALNP